MRIIIRPRVKPTSEISAERGRGGGVVNGVGPIEFSTFPEACRTCLKSKPLYYEYQQRCNESSRYITIN